MDTVTVSGMVLSAMPIGEYDRRIVLLTTDLGRISAFVRGARRPNSSLLAAARPFSMGEFSLHAGRDSYTVQSASIKEYFEPINADVTKMAYGCYFLEAAGFVSEENDDAKELLNLLYFSLKALENQAIPDELVRLIYEIRLFTVMGVYPQVFECRTCGSRLTKGWLSVERGNCICEGCANAKRDTQTYQCVYLDASAMYTLQYILTAPLGKLYTFCVEKPVQQTLYELTAKWCKRYLLREFKSLTVLEEMRRFEGTAL
jgi:DNA repair protein RecO (recombination protein O)